MLLRHKMFYICLQISYLSFIAQDSWSALLTLTNKTYTIAKCSVITGISRELWENNSGLWLAVTIINWFLVVLFSLQETKVGSLGNWKVTVMGLRASRRIHFIHPLGKQAVKPSFWDKNRTMCFSYILAFNNKEKVGLQRISSPISCYDAEPRVHSTK